MMNPLVHRAEYLVVIGGKPTVLCPTHAQDFVITAMLFDIEPELYEMDLSEEPIACQTCYLNDINGSKQKTSH